MYTIYLVLKLFSFLKMLKCFARDGNIKMNFLFVLYLVSVQAGDVRSFFVYSFPGKIE